jgi:hypothetical protein
VRAEYRGEVKHGDVGDLRDVSASSDQRASMRAGDAVCSWSERVGVMSA